MEEMDKNDDDDNNVCLFFIYQYSVGSYLSRLLRLCPDGDSFTYLERGDLLAYPIKSL